MRVAHAKLDAAEGMTLGPPGTDVSSLELLRAGSSNRIHAIVEHWREDDLGRTVQLFTEPNLPDWVEVWVTLLQAREGQGVPSTPTDKKGQA